MPHTLTNFNAAKSAIDAARVVSFDFFDTLVVRIVEEPWHAFFLVEKAIAQRTGNKRPFVAQRRQAESIARQRVWKNYARVEVTLDEIYDILEELGFRQEECRLYRSEEIAVEKAICYAEPFNKKLYEYAAANGKIVIITTDIYLPLETVEDIAVNCGYTARHRIFASSVHGESKAAHGLFSHVLDTLQKDGSISGSGDLLHIGDNLPSDVTQAEQWGIKTRHHRKPIERFREEGLKGWNLIDCFPDDSCPLMRSLTIGLYTRYWLENGTRPIDQLSMRDIGFYVVGPLLAGFAVWLYERCLLEKVKKLFFLARDGSIFQQAFEKVGIARGKTIETAYVYASRRAIYFPALTEMDGPANSFLVNSPVLPSPLREYFDRMSLPIEPFADELIKIFGSLDVPVNGNDFRLGHFFRSRVFPKIRKQIESERVLATAYMAQMGMLDGMIALCDIGYFGSMQIGFERLARLAGRSAQFRGYYFATNNKLAYGHQEMTGWFFDAQKPKENLESFYQAAAILELFFTGPHGTVLGYQREGTRIEPVLRPISKDEEQRISIVEDIQNGALAFVDMFLEYSDGNGEELNEHFCSASWRFFVSHPPAAALKLFADVKHNGGTGVSSYTPIIVPSPSWQNIIRNPDCLVRSYWHALWRPGYRASLSLGKRRYLDYLLGQKAAAQKTKSGMKNISRALEWCKRALGIEAL